MSRASQCGRADLLRLDAAVSGDTQTLIRLAARLGFRWAPSDDKAEAQALEDEAVTRTAFDRAGEIEFNKTALLEVPFLQPWRFKARGRALQVPQARRAIVEWRNPPEAPPRHPPLAHWCDLAPALRVALNVDRELREVDVAAATQRIARQLRVEHIPRQRRRRWPRRLEVIVDRSGHLGPLWTDQRYVGAHLRQLLPDAQITISGVTGPDEWPRYAEDRHRRWTAELGGSVVALTDLGALAADWHVAAESWLAIGREVLAAGGRAVALLPCAEARVTPGLRQAWTTLPWERPAPTLPQDSAREAELLHRLTVLVSPAVRVEPGLLRAVRLELVPEAAASLEVSFWRQALIESPNVVAATIAADALPSLRRAFAAVDPEDRRRLLAILKSWRPAEHKTIWFEEVLSASSHSLEQLPCLADLEDARDHVDLLAHRHFQSKGPALSTGTRAWVYRVDERGKGAIRHPSFLRIADAIRSDASAGGSGTAGPPVERLHLCQWGAALAVATVRAAASTNALLATLPADTGFLELILDPAGTDAVDLEGDGFWVAGRPPIWAADWGRDEHGAWASFRLETSDRSVETRLRWIPPGRFTMGSPSDEEGRWGDEGPRDVVIGEGFWLFATPVTQALYEAVTGENPSKFRGADRPVEQVSWNDAQRFMQQLNERVRDLDLVLPSEAQWEYACRAGTRTATYAGDPPDAALDAIAWYEGNSGGKTHPVGLKKPNAWGLYDMLGNVWERCADHWHDSYEGAPLDGSVWLNADAEDGASRVFRGGSWSFGARSCRAAHRCWFRPGNRSDGVGFRPARGQGERSDGRGAVPVEAAWRERSPASQPEPVVAQALRVVPDGAPATVALPRSGGFRVRSDRAELTFRRMTKPDWASGIGRDRYGLFVKFTISDVTQRLRWIPPGHFTMGSPPDEPGRWEDEGPQHEVTFVDGFWLFATPVTQALYEAVTGENPSRFQGADRPVERVSWADAQRFMQQLNELVPGLDLALPSEAQWEYACRAGTTTATGAVDLFETGASNNTELAAIAWYDKNSDRETHPVALKRPNAWGVSDILGNVNEWCQDHWHGRYEGAPTDGSAWTDPTAGDSASRVVRGGSWSDEARGCRAAYRGRIRPVDRDDDLGFRPARGQA